VLDLLKLKTFLAVAATHSFTRSAEELGLSQSTVTTHIQALERELDAQLFDRVGRKVMLTDAGRRTIDYANRLLALAEEAKSSVLKSGELSGAVSVSASEVLAAYRLPEILRRFQRLHPKVELSFAARSGTQAQIDAVVAGKLDLAIVLDEAIQSDRLITSTLRQEEVAIVMAPDYRASDSGARILLAGGLSGWLERVINSPQCPPGAPSEVGSIEAAKQYAIAGMGIAVLPKMTVAAELKRHLLVCVRMPAPPVHLHIQLVRNRGRWTSPALDALWSVAEQCFETEGALTAL